MSGFPTDSVTYLVTQASLSAGRSTRAIVEAAIDGGIDVIQLREKDSPARDRYELGLVLRDLTEEAGVCFIVNDRVDIAKAVDADGVHLGDEDLPIAVAREQLGPSAIIGRSVSTVAAAEAAVEAGADYLGVGSIYQTTSKDTPPEETAIGLDRLAEISASVNCPIVGIGGITPENAGAVSTTGANGVAVISAITAAEDPRHATQQLSAALENERSNI